MTEYINPHGVRIVTRASEFDIARARAIGNQADPDIYGRFPWVSGDYGDPAPKRRLNLSKASLGTFVEAVLRHGGDIREFFSMSQSYKGSYVQASVRLTMQGKESFEAETGFKLDCHPVIKLNSE